MSRKLEDRISDFAWSIAHDENVFVGRSSVSARLLALLEPEDPGCVGYTGCSAEEHLSDCPRW